MMWILKILMAAMCLVAVAIGAVLWVVSTALRIVIGPEDDSCADDGAVPLIVLGPGGCYTAGFDGGLDLLS